MNTIRLTKKTAYELISRISAGRNIKKDDTPPDVAIYRASTGPAGLTITCENDWFDHSGLIKLTISDGENQIVQYFNPNTLEREPTDSHKFTYNVGDRVVKDGHPGQVIGVKAYNAGICYLVDFDEPGVGFHNGEAIRVIVGRYGTSENCLWCRDSELQRA